jgi:hypothetical protein
VAADARGGMLPRLTLFRCQRRREPLLLHTCFNISALLGGHACDVLKVIIQR